MFHVEEWFSGKHYRADQFDEAAVIGQVKFIPGHYQETYVNLCDPEFSPYTSYQVSHSLRSGNLTRKTNFIWAARKLWEAKGLEQEVGGPLLMALGDLPPGTPAGYQAVGLLKTAGMDATKAKGLHDGTDPNWRLTAAEDSLDGVPVKRFTLSGKFPDWRPAMSSVEVSYWIGHQGKQPVCLQATMTNLTKHTYYESRRENFAENGYPRVWKHSSFENGALKKGMTITFHQVDPDAKFDEREVFLPESLRYYMMSDVTSGTGVPARDLFKETSAAESASAPAQPAGPP